MFDQRGVGYSEPALDCPEVSDLALRTIGVYRTREEETAEQAAPRTDALQHAMFIGTAMLFWWGMLYARHPHPVTHAVLHSAWTTPLDTAR